MFIWISVASLVVGAAVVVGSMLVQQLQYNEKVMAAKSKTLDTLKANNEAISKLREGLAVIDANADLATAKAKPEDGSLQVVLDALPTSVNTLALGSSLQNRFLTGIPGLDQPETLSVKDEQAEDGSSVDASSDTEQEEGAVNLIESTLPKLAINFEVTGTGDAITQLLKNFERSIRRIDIAQITIEADEGGKFKTTVNAKAYYQPPKTLEQKDEVITR